MLQALVKLFNSEGAFASVLALVDGDFVGAQGCEEKEEQER